ncbi:MAG TPA: T9SS type A sorting domain-containing protein [Bacteroidia bacterium]|nr:T9SS type A sorting domain-containing protein [Bacteroidia bacterium]
MKKAKKQFNILRVALCLAATLGAGTNYSNAQPYEDLDNDGYGSNISDPGGVANNLDCDDNCYACNPGATEILDGLDNDCDFLIDDGLMTVSVGADANSLFGYSAGQDVSRSASVSNGYPPYTYSWTLNRTLICNYINSSGDELFYGGTCSNNICPGSGSLGSAPGCNGSTINCRLLADGIVCVTVTDAQGSTATDCFNINAQDARCFSGSSSKVKVCHSTGSQSNPWVQICISENALSAHLSHNSGDYVGECEARQAGNDNASAAYEFLINPNPSAGQFTIQYSSDVNAAVKINITDLVGQVVYSENINDFSGQLTKQVDLGFLSAGVYMVNIENGSNKSIRKIVLEK